MLDTLAIENFISVKETEGPKMAAALEEHVKTYDVDIMNLQRAESLSPPDADGLITVKLASGATLRSRIGRACDGCPLARNERAGRT